MSQGRPGSVRLLALALALAAPGLAAAAVVQSDATGVTLELSLPSFELVPDPAAKDLAPFPVQRIDVPAGQGLPRSVEPGRPSLPTQGLLLALPPGAEVRLEIVEQSFREQAGVWIAPPPTTRVVEADGSETKAGVQFAAVPDPDVYGRDAFYPEAPARIAMRGVARDVDYVQVRLAPFQWNPVRRLLRVNDRLRVRVTFAGASAHATPAPERTGGASGVRNRLSGSAGRGGPVAAPAAAGPFVNDSFFANGPVPAEWRLRRRADRVEAALARVNAAALTDSAVKLEVDADGIYRVEHDELAAAGLATPVPVADLRLELRGAAVPLAVLDADGDGSFGPGDAVEFHGVANPQRWSATHVYWLTTSGGGARVTDRAALPSGSGRWPAFNSTRATARLEENELLVLLAPYDPDQWEPWVFSESWKSSRDPLNCRGTTPVLDLVVATPHAVAPVPGRIYQARGMVLGRKFGSCNPDDQQVDVAVNGTSAGSHAWSVAGDGMLASFALTVPSSALQVAATQQVRLSQPAFADPQGVEKLRWSHLDWIELDYERRLQADGDQLEFRGSWPAGGVFYLSGFRSPQVEVLDVRGDGRVERLVGARLLASAPGAPYTLYFALAPDPVSHRVVVTTRATLRTPRLVTDVPSSLRDPANRADYVAITYPGFRNGTQTIVDRRQAEGLEAMLVDAQDVYDEFSFGNVDAHAIQDFLAVALSDWELPPSYVLLVGDSTRDFRNHYGLPNSPAFLPHIEHYMPGGVVNGDSALQLLVGGPGDLIPDLLIGRLPAQSNAEVARYAAKLDRYEVAPPAAWNGRALFVADDFMDRSDVGDPAACPGPFTDAERYFVDQATCYLDQGGTNPDLQIVLEGEYTCSGGVHAGNQVLLDSRNAGLGFTAYVGHGSRTFLGAKSCCGTPLPQIFSGSDLPRLTQTVGLPLATTVACDVAAFEWLDAGSGSSRCMGETFILGANTGDIAFIGSMEVTTAVDGRDQLHGMLDALFQPLTRGTPYLPPFLAPADARRRAGAIHFGGQLGFLDQQGSGEYNVRTLQLIGDPAARLQIADPPVPPPAVCP